MKTITITITEELDAAAAAEAKRRGLSKSELIRLSLTSMLPSAPAGSSADLWRTLAGFGEDRVTAEPGDIDEVVYGS